MRKKKFFPQTPAGNQALEDDIKALEELIAKLEKAAATKDPRWLAGMRRHYDAEHARLVGLRDSSKK